MIRLLATSAHGRRACVIAALGLTATTMLTACSSASGTSDSSAGAKGKKVVYVWPDKEPTYTAVGCGAQDAAKKAGIDFSFSEPPRTFAPSDQVPVLNAVIAQHPDAIMISAADPKALVVPLKQAAQAGIKVVTVANDIDESSFVTNSVIGDNKDSGAKAADLLSKQMQGKKGDIAYIGYQRGGSTITDDRQDGFEAEIKKYPNLHYLGPTLSTVNSGAGAAATNGILSGHPNLLGIVGSFVPASTEMSTTLRERNRAGKLAAIALDADPTGLANIKNGSLSGIEAESFRQEGQQAMEQLANSFNGKPVKKHISVKPVEFTKANVDDPKMARYVPTSKC